jgi:hypothetical protein
MTISPDRCYTQTSVVLTRASLLLFFLCPTVGCGNIGNAQQEHDAPIVSAVSTSRRIVMADFAGRVGVWDSRSGALDWRERLLPGETAWLSRLDDGRSLALATVSDATAGEESALLVKILNAADLTDRGQRRIAGAPPALIIEPNLFVVRKSFHRGKDDIRFYIELWDTSAKTAPIIERIEDSDPNVSLLELCVIDREHVLLQRDSFAPDADGGFQSQMQPTGEFSSKRTSAAVDASELAILHIPSRKILRKCNTKLSLEEGCIAEASPGGRFTIVCTAGLIQLFTVPECKCRASLDVKSPLSIGAAAVSDNGRYVAFGLDQLHIWDTETGELRLVDSLNKDVLDADEPLVESGDVVEDWFMSGFFCLASVGFFEDTSEGFAVTRDGKAIVFDAGAAKVLRRRTVTVVPQLEHIRERVLKGTP